MNRVQENKVRKAKKKEIQLFSCKQVRGTDKYSYQTSTANYKINVNYENRQEQRPKPDKPRDKPKKKVKYLTEEIQRSQLMHIPRVKTNRNELTLKVSTLDDLEDLNVYQKCKSSKKEKKTGDREKRYNKMQQNVKNAHSNGNIKTRGAKSYSKSHKQLSVKCFGPKSVQKNKSFKRITMKEGAAAGNKQKSRDFEAAEMVDIQNSYYFSNAPSAVSAQEREENKKSQERRERQEKLKVVASDGKEQPSTSSGKKGMFLFDSRESQWLKPQLRIRNLQATVDNLN